MSLGSVGQKAHMLGFQRSPPLEVESHLQTGWPKRPWWEACQVDLDLKSTLGAVALRGVITAEVRRLAAIKRAARDAARRVWPRELPCSGQVPRGQSGAHVAMALATACIVSPGARGPGRRCAPSQNGWPAAQGLRPEGRPPVVSANERQNRFN